MMKVFVISLPEASERRTKIAELLNQAQVEFTFFDALRGDPNLAANADYAFKFRDKIYGRQMTAGEIGCFRSHRGLWQEAVATNQAICIMEDDVIPEPSFSQALALATSLKDYDILRLSGIFNRRRFVWRQLPPFTLVKYWRDPMGTQCYLITPQAAKRLLKLSQQISVPVDDFLGNYGLHRLNVIGCEPYPVVHDWDIPSQLGHRHSKRKMRVSEKVRRELLIQTQGVLSFLWQFKSYCYVKFKRNTSRQ